MPLFIKSLDKNIDLFCNRQNFNFNRADTQTDNDANFSLINFFEPTSNTKSITGFDFVTPEFKGFRFEQELSSVDTFGDFSLKTHDLFGTSSNIFKYSEITDEFTFSKKVNFTAGTNIVNGGEGSGSVTSVGITGGTGIDITGTPITTSGVIDLQLNTQLQALSVFATTGFISNDGNGGFFGRSLVAGDGITITNADGTSGNPVISASGAGGSGTVATTIDRTSDQAFIYSESNASFRIATNQLANTNMQLYMGRSLNNSSPLTSGYMFATSIDSGGRSSFSFNYVHPGSSNPEQTIFSVYRDTKEFNFHTYRLINLEEPTDNSDAATKNYVDTAISSSAGGGSITLTGDITGSGSGTVDTLLDTTINRTSDQSFRFPTSNTTGRFGILNRNPFSSKVQLCLGRGDTSADVWGYALESSVDNSGTPSFAFKYKSANTEKKIFSVFHNKEEFNFHTYRLINLAEPTADSDAATKNYVDDAVANAFSNGNLLSSNEISLNTDSGNHSWLRAGRITKSNRTIYGMPTSASDTVILENDSGSDESSGIAISGSGRTATIFTEGDSGSYLNIQDSDQNNSRDAYVSTSGSWTVVSSKKRKHSIKNKANNNVLDRFLKLSVRSYGYKYNINDKTSKRARTRMERKTNKMSIGLILEELFEVFPNCIPDYYNALFQDKKTKLDMKKELKDSANSGIDYNILLCYFIMAFQEYVVKTNKEIKKLKRK